MGQVGAAEQQTPPIRRPAIWGAALLFGAPWLSGMAVRLAHRQPWFGDFRAVVCGAERLAAHQPIYRAGGASCPDPHASAFVYLPWVARLAGVLRDILGGPAFAAAYVLLFTAAAAGMIWATALRAATPGPAGQRVRFLAFMGGNAFTLGNVAVPLHAAVGAAALGFRRRPWLYVAAVAAAGAVKPVFLAYLAVVMLSRRPLGWRVGACAAGAAAGLAPSVWMLAFGGETGRAWWRVLTHYVHQVTPGAGLYGWMSAAGLPTEGAGGLLAALAWAGLVLGAAMAAAERAGLDDAERTWVGLAAGVLIIPRLMGEDLFLLGPGVIVLIRTIGAIDPVRGRRAEAWVLGACVLALAGRLGDFARYSQPVAVLMIALAVLGAGAAALRSATRAPLASEGQPEGQAS